MNQLEIETLKNKRIKSKLMVLYKIKKYLLKIDDKLYCKEPIYISRLDHRF